MRAFDMQAVKEDYYFQMFYDDLPIWGFVGKMEKVDKPHGSEYRYFLFTHGEGRAKPQVCLYPGQLCLCERLT